MLNGYYLDISPRGRYRQRSTGYLLNQRLPTAAKCTFEGFGSTPFENDSDAISARLNDGNLIGRIGPMSTACAYPVLY